MIPLEQIGASLPIPSANINAANFRVIIFKKFELYNHGTSTSQTYRQTDRQTTYRTTAWKISTTENYKTVVNCLFKEC